MARREKRTPPTARQRRLAMVIGAILVLIACAVVFVDTIVNEGGHPITVAIVGLVLFLVFILPIVLAVRGAREGRHNAQDASKGGLAAG